MRRAVGLMAMMGVALAIIGLLAVAVMLAACPLPAHAAAAAADVGAAYTDADADMLARLMWGECRGVKSEMEKAAVVWTVLNRVDADGYADTIKGVVTAKRQFVGYSGKHPVDKELRELAVDVLERWQRERNGETDVGRVLPADYLWFTGDGKKNHFRNEYKTKKRWNWSADNPYSD